MKVTEKKAKQGLEVIEDQERRFTIIVDLPRHKESVRGQAEYRRILKAVIAECESRLGSYRRFSG